MFYVGQKVVRIKDGGHIKKGDVVTVTNLAECPTCGELHISTDSLHGKIGFIHADCADCGTDIKALHSEYFMSVARNFAPLESYRESYSIAIELVQQMEQVDKQKIFNPKKETV
jgi:transcription elongation factor Elf1